MPDQAITHKRILIVDDDHVIIRMIEGRLQAHGYEVISSTEAPVGLEFAMKNNPDLIILDVMMPIVNGYNFCRLIKSEVNYRKIPIILLTSRTGQNDIAIGQEVGADAYLPKPVNIEELLSKIKELLKS